MRNVAGRSSSRRELRAARSGPTRASVLETVALGDHDYAPVRNREPLSIADRIEADPFTRRHTDILVNNASPKLRSLLNGHSLKQDRAFDSSSFFDPRIGKQNRVLHAAAADDRAGRQ